MATSQSDAAKMEQIIREFFAKSLHIIVESRTPSSSSVPSTPSPSSSSSSSVQPRDKWFNLALTECPAALEQLNLCSPEYMVVDVILAEKLLGFHLQDSFPDKKQVSDVSIKEADGTKEKIIERWVVQYELEKSEVLTKQSSKRSLSSIYKKSMLLLRSLYATVRLLPAYKVFRQLNLRGHLCSCFLAHRVSSSAKPFSNRQKAEMQLYGFAPVDTSSGRLCISVLYLSKLSDVAPRKWNSISHKIIKEYVGSPLVSPVKRFCSFYGTAEGDVAGGPSSPDIQSLSNFSRRIAKDKDAVVNKIKRWNNESGVSLRPHGPQVKISCAFDDVDGDHPRESNSRNSNLSVGGLVDMLQKAQPLTREFASSGKETLKTTTDAALTDLADFVKLKDSLMGGGDSRTPRSSIKLNF